MSRVEAGDVVELRGRDAAEWTVEVVLPHLVELSDGNGKRLAVAASNLRRVGPAELQRRRLLTLAQGLLRLVERQGRELQELRTALENDGRGAGARRGRRRRQKVLLERSEPADAPSPAAELAAGPLKSGCAVARKGDADD